MSRHFLLENGEVTNAQARSAARMKVVDQLSPDLRKVVHEYGYMVVSNFLNCGVKKPKHIRHLVETVLNEFSPTRGSFSRQGIKPPRERMERIQITSTDGHRKDGP